MDELQPSVPGENGGERYREEWGAFYAARRRLLIRLLWLGGGLIISALLLFRTMGDHYPPLAVRIAIAGSFGLLLIAFLPLWFFFVWQMATWPCPQCAKRFFFSALAFDPFFTRRCRHCGLQRLKREETRGGAQ